VQIANFALLSRTGKPADATKGGSIFTHIHIGPIGVFDNKPNYDWGYVDVAENNGEKSFNSKGGWLGFTDKYWLGALIPDQKTAVSAKFRASGDVYQAQIIPTRYTSIAVGSSFDTSSRLFAGAKEMAVLSHYSKDLAIPYLDYAIDWGWFWFIAIPFFWILHWLFGVFGNFGVAIIGLTLIVRGFMYPVAQKQFASMAQMRAVQPKLKALQERWKDDKPRLQQEMMKLYKDEKVNPLAGCLPVVLQIPIFFALYKNLLLSIEMRHQPFILWLQDLSAPDPSAHILFDALGTGFALPAFLAIGVLPILLGLTMWLMQRLNPQPMDDVQKQVFAVMPWFLMFIMAPFAAGLQLYWVMSNVVSIAQQKWLYSRHPVLREQMARDAEEKAQAKANAKA
jgi:YidC/Oxa1 family membrane protein insertase